MALLTRKKKPNQRLVRFKELCAKGMKAEEAGAAVGFAATTATKYRTKHAKEIKAMAADRFDLLVPEAVAALHGNLTDRSGAVRQAAANRILEGADLGVINKSEVRYFKTDQELDNELLEACGGDPEVVRQVLGLIAAEKKSKTVANETETETVH